jgi:hypothetical protein
LISANECFNGPAFLPAQAAPGDAARRATTARTAEGGRRLRQSTIGPDAAKVQLRLRQRREDGERLPARRLETVQAVAHRSVRSISTHGCFLTINCRIGVVIIAVTIAMITGIVNAA